jgi:hypothetical protein
VAKTSFDDAIQAIITVERSNDAQHVAPPEPANGTARASSRSAERAELSFAMLV